MELYLQNIADQTAELLPFKMRGGLAIQEIGPSTRFDPDGNSDHSLIQNVEPLHQLASSDGLEMTTELHY